jgi:Fe-S-cluster containining protein
MIPSTNCKGLCAASCGPIHASDTERALLAERGVRVGRGDAALLDLVLGRLHDCPALIADRCTVYDIRPTICRLWGAVENMPCPWGCIPTGGHLSAAAGYAILNLTLDRKASP